MPCTQGTIVSSRVPSRNKPPELLLKVKCQCCGSPFTFFRPNHFETNNRSCSNGVLPLVAPNRRPKAPKQTRASLKSADPRAEAHSIRAEVSPLRGTAGTRQTRAERSTSVSPSIYFPGGTGSQELLQQVFWACSSKVVKLPWNNCDLCGVNIAGNVEDFYIKSLLHPDHVFIFFHSCWTGYTQTRKPIPIWT